jgi:hypothetical protein
MNSVVSFSASAKYGYGGKQYIARITGRDPKFTFSREFIDRKEGKRRDSSSADVDDPGLYVEVDIDKHGDKDETFYIVYECPGYGLMKSGGLAKETAMPLAKLIDAGHCDWTQIALMRRLEAAEAKPDSNTLIDIPADQLGLKAGKVPRRELIAALRIAMGLEPPAPVEPEISVTITTTTTLNEICAAIA